MNSLNKAVVQKNDGIVQLSSVLMHQLLNNTFIKLILFISHNDTYNDNYITNIHILRDDVFSRSARTVNTEVGSRMFLSIFNWKTNGSKVDFIDIDLLRLVVVVVVWISLFS